MTRRVYSVLIICAATVASLWTYEKGLPSVNDTIVVQNPDIVSAIPYQNTSSGGDWKKLLSNVASSPVTPQNSNGQTGQPEDNTLTSQMAKDLLSRYLAIAPQGDSLTGDQLMQVASDTLATPDYTTSQGTVYVASNLNIIPRTDTDTIKKYRDQSLEIFQKRAIRVTEDPVQILAKALSANNPNELDKLNPFIIRAKGIINDLLAIPVPSDAIDVHLELLNAYSDITTDFEGMHVVFTDPALSVAAINTYSQHVNNLQKALDDMAAYFKQRLAN